MRNSKLQPKKGNVIITKKGAINRITPEEKELPGGPRYTSQKLDTTGYSKGKQNFNLTTKPHLSLDPLTPKALKDGKPIVKNTNIPRSKVKETIENLKKGSSKTVDLRDKEVVKKAITNAYKKAKGQ